MDTLQFILRYNGTVTINNEYTVTIPYGSALEINWFPENSITVETKEGRFTFNTANAVHLGGNKYLIEIETMEDLSGLPVRFERGDYLVAGNIVINHRNREYFKADRVDIFENEIVATRGGKMTRITFNGDKATAEQYTADK